ncbi:MAG: CBS domain-containing protein [Anaerolineales bacterium]
MKVESILKAKGSSVTTTTPDATIATIIRVLKDKNIGALVVSEDGSTVLGLIAERAIVHGLCDYGTRLLDLRVSDLMTRTVLTCAPGDSLTRVMAQMTRYRVRQLPVVEDGKLRGIVSIGDVVKYRLDELELEANILRDAFLARR